MLLLTEIMEMRDAAWEACKTDAARSALREEYRLAGWKVCPHADCPPHNCRR